MADIGAPPPVQPVPEGERSLSPKGEAKPSSALGGDPFNPDPLRVPPPLSGVVEDLTPEERQYKASRIATIKHRFRLFPDRLKDAGFSPGDLNLMTIEQIIEKDEETRMLVNLGETGLGNVAMYAFGINMAVVGLEKMLPKLGLQCEGLSTVLQSSKEFQGDVKEFALEYGGEIEYQDPAIKIARTVAMTCYQLDILNRRKKQLEAKKVDTETEKKFEDL